MMLEKAKIKFYQKPDIKVHLICISHFSRSSHGFMHMRIQLTGAGQYILGQFSRPFNTIAEMINYYTVNRLPIKGAEHTSLRTPLCEQLL